MKSKLFRAFIFIIIALYFLLLFLSIYKKIFPFYKSWFSFALIFLALLLFPRYIIYGIDTNLWAGLNMLLAGAFGVMANFYKLALLYYFIGYISCFSVSSLLIFLLFRQIFHFKIFTFTLLFDIILIVYAKGVLPVWLMIPLLSVTALIATIFVVKAIISNTRKV